MGETLFVFVILLWSPSLIRLGGVEIVTLTVGAISTWRFRKQIARSKKTPALQAKVFREIFSAIHSPIKLFMATNEKLSPTFRGNENTINDNDSQTSLLPIFSEGGIEDVCTPVGKFPTHPNSIFL